MALQSFTEINRYFFQSFRLDYSKLIQLNAIPKKWSWGEGGGSISLMYEWPRGCIMCTNGKEILNIKRALKWFLLSCCRICWLLYWYFIDILIYNDLQKFETMMINLPISWETCIKRTCPACQRIAWVIDHQLSVLGRCSWLMIT